MPEEFMHSLQGSLPTNGSDEHAYNAIRGSLKSDLSEEERRNYIIKPAAVGAMQVIHWLAISRLLEDCEWKCWSDREIAEQCAVHHKMVGELRRDVTGVLSSDERTYTTKHIISTVRPTAKSLLETNTSERTVAEAWGGLTVIFQRVIFAADNCCRSQPTVVAQYNSSDLSLQRVSEGFNLPDFGRVVFCGRLDHGPLSIQPCPNECAPGRCQCSTRAASSRVRTRSGFASRGHLNARPSSEARLHAAGIHPRLWYMPVASVRGNQSWSPARL